MKKFGFQILIMNEDRGRRKIAENWNEHPELIIQVYEGTIL